MPYSIQLSYFNRFRAVSFSRGFSDSRGGYCYASLLNGRCANQNSQVLTKMQCCCDSGRCWSDGSTPEMCPIRGTGGVTRHHMALNFCVSPSLNTELTSCCFSHNRRLPETVHSDPWWEWWSADTWSCPREPRPTWHLPSSISWSNSWAGSWSDSWSNSHPCSSSCPWPRTGSVPRPIPRPHPWSRSDHRTISRATTYTASSARYASTFSLCLLHIHTHRMICRQSWHVYFLVWLVDVQYSTSKWSCCCHVHKLFLVLSK